MITFHANVPSGTFKTLYGDRVVTGEGEGRVVTYAT